MILGQAFVFFITWGLCYLSVLIQVDPITNELKTRSNATITSVTQPAILCLIIYYIFASMFYRRHIVSPIEHVVASWFLHNGGVIHMAMEGLGAGWNLWHEVNESYQLIDKRFDFSTHDLTIKNFDVFLITQLELFVWSPLCLLTAVSFSCQSKHRYLLSIITSVCHIVGTIFFVAPPIYNQCLDLPPFDIAGCFPDITPFSMIFYYLAFGVNFIWIIFPLCVIFWAWKKQNSCLP